MTRGKDEAAVSFLVLRGFRTTVYRIPIHVHPPIHTCFVSIVRILLIILLLFIFFPSRPGSIMHACLPILRFCRELECGVDLGSFY